MFTEVGQSRNVVRVTQVTCGGEGVCVCVCGCVCGCVCVYMCTCVLMCMQCKGDGHHVYPKMVSHTWHDKYPPSHNSPTRTANDAAAFSVQTSETSSTFKSLSSLRNL